MVGGHYQAFGEHAWAVWVGWRFQQNTTFPTWSGEGDGCGLWSPRRGGKNKKQKTTKKRKGEGQEMYTNIYRREVLPGRRRLLVLYVDVDVHIFNIKTELKGV